MLSTFYEDVLPPTGHFALWTKSDKQNTWYGSLAELTAATEDLGDTQGVYFATASFTEQAAINGNKDARTQANVASLKAFRLDLDAGEKKLEKHGPDKVYATQAEALRDTIRFAKESLLPPSYIISSGEGLHLYWVLDIAVSREAWTPLAKKLSRLAEQLGVKQDFAVTTDSARVLRPVGTVHENGKEVRALQSSRRVYSLESFEAQIVSLLVEGDDDFMDAAPKRERMGINQEAMVVSPPKSIKKIVPQCAALADVIRVKGNVEEPYWRAMIGIVKHTVEGDKAAHIFSSGHPSYDRRETQAKLDNWTTGPTTCAEFGKYSKKCKTCAHFGKIKSPIVKGYMTTEQVAELPPESQPEAVKAPAPTGAPWDNCLPPGFYVKTVENANTLFYNMPVDEKDEDGESITRYLKVPFTTDIFWFGQWSDAEHSDDTAQVFLHKWTGTRIAVYTLDQTLIANQQKLREFLASKSIIVGSHPKAAKAMEEYSKMQMTSIKAVGSMPKVSKRFGVFITDEGNMAVAHGEYIISHTGEIDRAIVGQELSALAPLFALPLPPSGSAHWDASVWDDHIIPKARKHVEFMRKYYRRPGLEKFQLASMLSMASPFMAFVTGEYLSGKVLPPNGLSVSLYSAEGGRGKTTLMRASMLAYGRPQAMTSDRNDATATANSRVARLSIMGTMPVGMDEMGATSAATCASLVSVVANGAGKERATKEGGLNLGSPFALVNLMAANKSARDMIASNSEESSAIQYRLLELDVDNIGEFDVEVRNAFTQEWSELATCAGALGAVIHREMCKLGVHRVNQLVVGAVAKASAKLESEQTDRFQYRGLGAVMALHVILQRIGMDMFDLGDIVKEFTVAYASGQSYALDHSLPTEGLPLLNMALHDLTAHTAITEYETRRTRHVTKYDEPLVDVPHVVHARHIVSTRTTYVSANALRKWCADRKVSFMKVITAAKKAGVMTQIYAGSGEGKAQSYNLMKGMRGSTGAMVSCYALDISRLLLVSGKDHVAAAIADADGEAPVPMSEEVPVEQQAVLH
jgi:hypothetical protein